MTEIITSQPPVEIEHLEPVKVAFIGAGGINFGSFEGPWNHAKHISRIPGVEIVGVSDINTRLAERRISEKQQSMDPSFCRSNMRVAVSSPPCNACTKVPEPPNLTSW